MAKADRAAIIAALKNPKAAREAARPQQVKRGDGKYTAEEKARMDAEGKGLSGATKGWAERFKIMNSANYWVCFCFRDDEGLQSFLDRLDLTPDEDRMVPGAVVAKALGVDENTPVEELPGRRLKRHRTTKAEVSWSAKYRAHPRPDDGADTGDLAHDLSRDLLDWLDWADANGQDQEWLEQHGTTIDYPHYVVVWFHTSEQRIAFLRLTYLIEVGDKYLDGYRALDVLNGE